MLNKNERMEKMNEMGINTGKYFTVNLPQGLAKNSTITLSINENGDYVVMNPNANIITITKENDPILNQIIEDGYVRNTKLHRRFVMAQMFHMLNYVSYDRRESGYNAYLRRMYGYNYTLKMMLEEARVLSKLEVRDRETFEERVHFFDRNTIATVLEDYLIELKKYVENLPTKNCKGVPYKKVKGVNIFVADLDKKLYYPVRAYASKVRCAKNYNEVYCVLSNFMKNMVTLPYNTKKSSAWIDAYKGEGAFYTLKNLVMFHDCTITAVNGINYGVNSMAYLNTVLNEYKGEGWRMFALMKKVIKDNNFDFKARMNEIYNK